MRLDISNDNNIKCMSWIMKRIWSEFFFLKKVIDDFQAGCADIVILGVAFLTDLAMEATYSINHQAKHVYLVLVLVVLAQLQQLSDQRQSNIGQVVIINAQVIIAYAQKILMGQQLEGLILLPKMGDSCKNTGDLLFNGHVALRTK